MSFRPKRRRRCDLESCRQLYLPKQKHQRFCCPDHKTEFHLRTPSFRKLKHDIVALMRRELKPEAFKHRDFRHYTDSSGRFVESGNV